MGTRFTAPEGALRSNLGLLAGTLIQELRMHPFLDRAQKEAHWCHQPEWLEFTVLSIVSGGYLCRYAGKETSFRWPFWTKQPNYGFMEDGCTPVKYYIKDRPQPPPPYRSEPGSSPYVLRCMEIDEAALLIQDPDAFAEAAADPEIVKMNAAFHERPTRKFAERGGCPFYQGRMNCGSGSGVLCEAVRPCLHGYVEIKFCGDGRKVYCPIWRAKGVQ